MIEEMKRPHVEKEQTKIGAPPEYPKDAKPGDTLKPFVDKLEKLVTELTTQKKENEVEISWFHVFKFQIVSCASIS